MRRSQRPVLGLVLLSLVVALAIGCRQEVPPLFRRNQRPETSLTIVPEDSATGFYRYHVYWNGRDPDGRVVRFLFAITDTLARDEEDNWDPELAEDRDRGVYTNKTDSIFLFNAERGQLALHIVAIDDFGARDRSPARAFFFTRNRGLPQVRFLDVIPFRDDPMDTRGIVPCDSAAPCTVQTYTNFRVRFSGTTNNGRITGFQWRIALPGQTGPTQPFGIDSLFLRAGSDTFGLDADGDTLWALHGETISVFFYNRYPPSNDSLPSGGVTLSARVRDDARLLSPPMAGRRRVIVNHDPLTVLFKRIPACDCPNPPPDCASRDSVAAGWISGFDLTLYPEDAWIPFCDGDTLPQRAHVRLYASGFDDQRDLPIDRGAGLREVRFRWRFTWCAGTGDAQTCFLNTVFSPMRPARTYFLPAPASRPWRGHRNGIGDVQYIGLCPFEWTFYGAAADEWGRPDGTPDSISVAVSGSPTVDSVAVPSVLVLVPACNPNDVGVCPDTARYRYSPESLFGPDTLMTLAAWSLDFPPMTPCFLGRNDFVLPLRVYGHDHPRDRHPDIQPENRGRILAWTWRLDCQDCEDPPMSGEGQWRDDVRPAEEPIERQVFDEPLRLSFALDTLLLTPGNPCGNPGSAIRAVLPAANFGRYRFQVRGRDTAALAGECRYPSVMDSTGAAQTRATATLGRLTQLVVRDVHIVQYADVRPVGTAPPPQTGASYGARAPRKRWFR